MTISIDYGAPPFRFTGPWECAIDGAAVRQELPLAGFFDDESGEWHLMCDTCANSDSASIQLRLNHYAETLGPDDGRAPFLRRLALHDWELRTPGLDAKGMWLMCSNGHWFPRPAQPDAEVPGWLTDGQTAQQQGFRLAKCPHCRHWVGMLELS